MTATPTWTTTSRLRGSLGAPTHSLQVLCPGGPRLAAGLRLMALRLPAALGLARPAGRRRGGGGGLYSLWAEALRPSPPRPPPYQALPSGACCGISRRELRIRNAECKSDFSSRRRMPRCERVPDSESPLALPFLHSAFPFAGFACAEMAFLCVEERASLGR